MQEQLLSPSGPTGSEPKKDHLGFLLPQRFEDVSAQKQTGWHFPARSLCGSCCPWQGHNGPTAAGCRCAGSRVVFGYSLRMCSPPRRLTWTPPTYAGDSLDSSRGCGSVGRGLGARSRPIILQIACSAAARLGQTASVLRSQRARSFGLRPELAGCCHGDWRLEVRFQPSKRNFHSFHPRLSVGKNTTIHTFRT